MEIENASQPQCECQKCVLTKPCNPTGIGDNHAENILSTIAYAVLALGGLLAIVALIVCTAMAGKFLDNYFTGFLAGIVGGAVVFAIYAVIWAQLMIMVNISNNVRQIKHRLQGVDEVA